MKKALILLPVMALAACDRPIYTVDNLHCEGADSKTTKIDIYKDYAVVNSNNIANRMDLVRQFDNAPIMMNIYEKDGIQDLTIHTDFNNTTLGIVYKDHRCFFEVPDGDVLKQKEYVLTSQTKKVNKKILNKIFALSDIEKTYQCIEKIVGLTSASRLCDEPIGPDGVDIAIGNGEFRHYSQAEAEAKHIYNCSVPEKYAVIVNGYGMLTQEDALKISKNWDYNNIKLYNHEDGQKMQEHEKDACEVLERLNKFIDTHEPRLSDFKIIQEAMADCGDTCNTVIAKGEMGDFLIQLPETKALLKIANKNKNAKFLSVFNPNQYTKTGYCLVNIVPYNTMKQLGTPDNTCHYRIYCGAPEFMNYDEFYAVEVCE